MSESSFSSTSSSCSSSSASSSSSSKSSASFVDDFLAASPVMLFCRTMDRQQRELHAGAHLVGQGAGHCGGASGGAGSGAGAGKVAGQIDGYDEAGDMGHEFIPQGRGQGDIAVVQGGG